MSKEMLKGLIDLLNEKDTETIFRVLVRFVPEDRALPDEIEALERANESIRKAGTVPFDAVDWDSD